MANQVDPATAAGTASGGATGYGAVAPSHGEAGLDAAAVHGEGGPGAVAATGNVAQLGPHPPFHGRRVSWVAVSIIMAGFLIGGLAMIFGHHGPTWWLFWAGVGIAVVGVLLTFATNTFEDWY
jgi:hypothetical protein